MSTITLTLSKLDQLIRESDPDVFPSIGLDEDAANFIYNEADLHKIKENLKLNVYLPQKEIKDNALELIKQISKNYFLYQERVAKQAIHMNFVRGRRNLFVSVIFITCCLLSYFAIINLFTLSNTASDVIRGIFTIGSWVSIWIPIQAFLFDWWPIRRQSKIFKNLSNMEIEIAPRDN